MISLCTTLLKLQLICLVSPEFLNECGYKDGVCEGKHITQVVWSIFDHLPGYRCPGSEYSLKYNGPYTYYVITLGGKDNDFFAWSVHILRNHVGGVGGKDNDFFAWSYKHICNKRPERHVAI